MAEMRAFYSYSALRYVEAIIQLVETGLLSEFWRPKDENATGLPLL